MGRASSTAGRVRALTIGACVMAAALWVILLSNGAFGERASTAATDSAPSADASAAADRATGAERGAGAHPVGTGGRQRTPHVDPAPSPHLARTRAVTNGKRGQVGFATYYARALDGQRTASGSTFDNDALIAAHPRHPFGTTVRVTNLANGRSVTVRIVDRGPSRGPRANGVIIDLSRAAAEALDFIRTGRARVRLEVLERAG